MACAWACWVGPKLASFYLKKKLMGWTTCHLPQSFKKKKRHLHRKTTYCLGIPRIRPLWWPLKQGSRFFFFLQTNSFSTHFEPKTPWKHPKNLIKPIHGLQKSKNKTDTKSKIFPSWDLFLDIFKIKKTLHFKSPSHTELFEIKINRLGGYNRHQRPLFR